VILKKKEVNLAKEKIFLIVFHGGMVGYLWLHNLIIPLIRNLGTDRPLLLGIHFWFFYHTIILYKFFKYDFKKRSPSLIPFLIDSSFFCSLFGILQMCWEFGHMVKPNLSQFSSTISLASIMIFFMGFFIYFKKFINWKLNNRPLHYLYSCIFGLSIFVFLYNIELHFSTPPTFWKSSEKKEKSIKAKQRDKRLGCDPNFKVFSPSYSGKVSNHSTIMSCGLSPNVIRTNKNGIYVENISKSQAHLRLELLQQQRWNFIKIIKVKIKEKKNISNQIFLKQGVYRLKSVTGNKLGIQIILNKKIFFPKTNIIQVR